MKNNQRRGAYGSGGRGAKSNNNNGNGNGNGKSKSKGKGAANGNASRGGGRGRGRGRGGGRGRGRGGRGGRGGSRGREYDSDYNGTNIITMVNCGNAQLSDRQVRVFISELTAYDNPQDVVDLLINTENGPKRLTQVARAIPQESIISDVLALGNYVEQLTGFYGERARSRLLVSFLVNSNLLPAFLRHVTEQIQSYALSNEDADRIAWILCVIGEDKAVGAPALNENEAVVASFLECYMAGLAGNDGGYDAYDSYDAYGRKVHGGGGGSGGGSSSRRDELASQLMVALGGNLTARMRKLQEITADFAGDRHSNDQPNVCDVAIMPTCDEVLCKYHAYLPAHYSGGVVAADGVDGPHGAGDADYDDYDVLDAVGGSAFVGSEASQIPNMHLHHDPTNGAAQRSALATTYVIDYNFRLLREDMIGPFRENLLKEMDPQQGRRSRARGFRRRYVDVVPIDICVREDDPRNREECIAFAFRVAGENKKALKAEFWQKSNALPHGCVVALLEPGSDEPMFGEVVRRVDGELLGRGYMDASCREHQKYLKSQGRKYFPKGQGKCVIGLRLSTEDTETVMEAMFRKPKPAYKMFEAFPSFFAYKPILEKLQNLTSIRFAEELVFQTADAIPPAYYNARTLDGVIQTDPDLRRKYAQLDGSQQRAFRTAISNRVGLIQGPPGTGKTHVGVLVVRAILQMLRRMPPRVGESPRAKILCVCYTNHALDQFLENLLDVGITSIVRIGHTKVDRLEPYHISKLRHEKNKDLGRQIGRTIGQIEAAQEEAEKLKGRLRQPEFNHFKNMNEFLAHYDPAALREFRVPSQRGGFQVAGGKGKNKAFNDVALYKEWRKGTKPADLPGDLGQYFTSPTSVWALSKADRATMLSEWEAESTAVARRNLAIAFERIRDLRHELSYIRAEAKRELLANTDIIGCTTTGAAKYSQILQAANSRVVLVEEAGEVLDGHIFTALNNAEHLIMIGDHLQLRPKVQNYALSVECHSTEHELNVSLFERLAKSETFGPKVAKLGCQHRMRPEISSTIRGLHYDWLQDAPDTQGRPNIVGLSDNVVFFKHDALEDSDGGSNGSTTKVNSHEVGLVVTTVKYLIQQGYMGGQIVVLTPYVGQMLALRKALERHWSVFMDEMDIAEARLEGELLSDESDYSGSDYDDDDDYSFYSDSDDESGGAGGAGGAGVGGGPARPAAGTAAAAAQRRSQRKAARRREKREEENRIRVATIDNYQGNESDIVVASLVRGNSANMIGFLGEPTRVNVLLSRARNGMIIVGNLDRLMNARNPSHKAYWRKVAGLMGDHLYEGLPVLCEAHGKSQLLQSAEDFENCARDGGCDQLCDRPLGCGHNCEKLCHTTDRDHSHARANCTKEVKIVACPSGHARTVKCNEAADTGDACVTCNVIAERNRKAEQNRKKLDVKHAKEMEKLERKHEVERAEVEAAEERLKAELERKGALLALEMERVHRRKAEALANEAAAAANDERDQELALAKALAEAELEELRVHLAANRQAADAARAAQEAAVAERLQLHRKRVEDERRATERAHAEAERRALARLARAEKAAKNAREAARARAVERANELAEREREIREEYARRETEARRQRARDDAFHADMLARLDDNVDDVVNVNRTCMVCYNDAVRIVDGVECGGGAGGDGERHFMCDGCFEDFVASAYASRGTMGKDQPGPLMCPWPKCGACFDLRTIADHCSVDTLIHFSALKAHHFELVKVAEMDAEYEARLQRELDELKNMEQFERDVRVHVTRIREDVLNLACPNCKRVFNDFEGCFAVRCDNCKHSFCGWCLEDCGEDAHAHVARCPHKQGTQRFHGRKEQFDEVHRRRRNLVVGQYLERLDAKTAAAVVANCRQDFVDLGLDTHDEYSGGDGGAGDGGAGNGGAGDDGAVPRRGTRPRRPPPPRPPQVAGRANPAAAAGYAGWNVAMGGGGPAAPAGVRADRGQPQPPPRPRRPRVLDFLGL